MANLAQLAGGVLQPRLPRSPFRLAGGFQKGDRVISQIDHTSSNVVKGDVGIVIGPAPLTIDDHAQRVCVDFGSGKGYINNVLVETQIGHVPLAGGFQRGDRVISLLDYAGVHVVKGDMGTVVGPCSDHDLVDKAKRVCIEFEAGKGRVDMLAASNIEHVLLVCGFQMGDKVISRVDCVHIHLVKGDVGIVVGPCRLVLGDKARRVKVDFGPGKGKPDLHAVHQIDHVPLAGGFQKGDRVISLMDHAATNVVKGDVGTVVGPCAAELGDKAERVCIDFGAGKGRADMLVAGAIEHAPLACGFQKGDRVISLIDHAPIHLVKGDVGTVVGPCSTELGDKAMRVQVNFGPGEIKLELHAVHQVEHVPLAGGFQKGDRVISLMDHAAINLVKGDVGTVVGPCAAELGDKVKRVCIEFGAGKGRADMLVAGAIEHAPLACGFQKGDRVISLIDHAPIHLVKGDVGTVVGPCSAELGDKARRVIVNFGPGKGKLNIYAVHQVELLSLAGGFQKGDRVISLMDHAATNVVKGDVGTVVGPCAAELGDKAERLCIEFGAGKGRADMLVAGAIEHAPLACGFQKGDRVISLIDHAPIHLVKGDVGTVVGPCSAELGDKALRVQVNFGPGKGKLDLYAVHHVEHVPLAGGFQKGDRVISLMDHAATNVVKGDVGTVVGPCAAVLGDKAERLCIEFGAGKGRADMLVAGAIEHAPLACGFQKGDRVISLIDHAPIHLVKGDVGTVVGPCSAELGDKALRVQVNFGPGKGKINASAAHHIKPVPLAGGFQKGARVISLVDHVAVHLVKGDVGTVVGPCGDHDLVDKVKRVCIEFGAGKGRVNILAASVIEHVPLVGGFLGGGGRAPGGRGGASVACGGSGGLGRSGSGARGRGMGGNTFTSESAPAIAVGRKRKAVYASILSPPAKVARNGEVAGSPADGAGRGRPVFNEDQISKDVNTMFKWQWRSLEGTYVAFDTGQCIDIETCWRRGMWGARVWGKQFPVGNDENLKCTIDFEDMSAYIAGSVWATAARRWDRDVAMGNSWDHQTGNVHIVKVEHEWSDHAVVLSAFFDRKRLDDKTPIISRRTHSVVQVRRVQNRSQRRQWEAQKSTLEEQRGKDAVHQTTEYAWHGSGRTRPDVIATGKGFMMQYNNPKAFYQQGTYSAYQSSYSHHKNYVYRSSDIEGLYYDAAGKYFHLMLVNVLRGTPLKTTEVWCTTQKGTDFNTVQGKLGQDYDSVEGGPHQPTVSGPYTGRELVTDESIIYVVYSETQCLPEFIVTYMEN